MLLLIPDLALIFDTVPSIAGKSTQFLRARESSTIRVKIGTDRISALERIVCSFAECGSLSALVVPFMIDM